MERTNECPHNVAIASLYVCVCVCMFVCKCKIKGGKLVVE